jgi:hypothetical protein
MLPDASKKLLEKTMNVDSSNLSSLVSQPSALDSLSIGNVVSLKSKLLGSFNDLKSLQDISPSKLQGLAGTLGVDLGSFKQLLDISVRLEKIGVLSGDVDLIKSTLLKEISIGNLLGVANEGGVKKLLADFLKIDVNELTNMFNSAEEIKTLSDIKSLDQYKNLDKSFKEKISNDNGITVEMLDIIVASSVKLFSKNELERKEAEGIAKNLEEDFTNLLFETQVRNLDVPKKGGEFDFANDFTKTDYRVQKIAALSLGFGDGEKSVDNLIDTIDKIKRLAALQTRERDLKRSLVEHLGELSSQTELNDSSLKSYSEECGVDERDVAELINDRNAILVELNSDVTPIGVEQTQNELDNAGDCKDGSNTFGLDSALPETDFGIKLFEFEVFDIEKFEQEDGKFTYNGDVSFDGYELKIFNMVSPFSQTIRIPIKIHKVNGNVHVTRQALTTLENMPEIVTGDFNCSHNNLQNLNGLPKEIGGNLNISFNKIKVLKNIQSDIKGNFICSNNQIESLNGSPTYVRGNFDCSSNLLDDLQGSSLQVFGDMNCINNELNSLRGAPDEVQGTFDCSNNYLTQNPELLRTGNTLRVRGKFICENQKSGNKLDPAYLKETFGASSVIV